VNSWTADRRRKARNGARAACAFSACMFLLSLWTVVVGERATAATNGGAVTLTPSSGTSATDFDITMLSGGYSVRTYLIPGAADPNSLTFNGSGPIAVGSELRKPLYDNGTNPIAGIAPSPASTPGGPGLVSGLPKFSFGGGVFLPGEIPDGTYNLGIACSKGDAGPGQLDKFWNVRITITAQADAGPAGFDFAVAADQGTTTTTTTGDSTTTTTTGGSTTTTTAGDGSTTTTQPDGSTTTTTSAGGGTGVSGSGLGGGSGPSGASPVTPLGQLPYTGGSPLPLVFWAVLLLVFGRMAMLLGKKPKVRSAG
jgi:hypothetical protein